MLRHLLLVLVETQIHRDVNFNWGPVAIQIGRMSTVWPGTSSAAPPPWQADSPAVEKSPESGLERGAMLGGGVDCSSPEIDVQALEEQYLAFCKT